MLTFLPQTVHCVLFMDPQISLFSNFCIKNGSHDTIYTFKNYFAIVISAISFQFQQNKSYPNRPIKANTYFYNTLFYLIKMRFVYSSRIWFLLFWPYYNLSLKASFISMQNICKGKIFYIQNICRKIFYSVWQCIWKCCVKYFLAFGTT